MNYFGEIFLIITAFIWAWGAEISKKIIKHEGYHAKFFTFWGGYHRFNRWVLSLVDTELGFIQLLTQGALCALFFFPIALILGNWYYWSFFVIGGGSFVMTRLILERKKRED